MNPLEAYNLLTDVQQDYAGMVRELNRLNKNLVKPADPWSLPLMERMTAARRDLAMAAGCNFVLNPDRKPFWAWVEFKDADDLRAFGAYCDKAKAIEGTIGGLYSGLMCSALKRAAVQHSK